MKAAETNEKKINKIYDTVVVGAGPYGLSIAAHLQEKGQNIAVFGKPLYLWKNHMPKGMLLRSIWWASFLSDPQRKFDLVQYGKKNNIKIPHPLPMDMFLDYSLWFQKNVLPNVDETYINNIVKKDGNFVFTLADGREIQSKAVVMACGLAYYVHIPDEFTKLPKEFVSHTYDYGDFEHLKGKDIVIVGGGQSALETGAIMHENGINIEIVMRKQLNWLKPDNRERGMIECLRTPDAGMGAGWINRALEVSPYFFQKLPRKVKDWHLNGRGKHGPAGSFWLKSRLEKVTINENEPIKDVKVEGKKVVITLKSGKVVKADHVILATGYKADLDKLYMIDESLRRQIKVYKGMPVLNGHFESTIKDMYFVGYSSHMSFGPLYRFIVGAPATAKRVAKAITKNN
ncbi:MAG TPA: NAD(P)-binding domain-containing protein [Candidatus Saccharimonadales bacterium]|nr:NAD(P)-binding domain-containing protein [Candidatus Saccharimonadales bacterium]